MPPMSRREMLKVAAFALQSKVRLCVPGKIEAVTLMRSGAAVETKQDREWIAMTVPRLLVWEAIRVDLA